MSICITTLARCFSIDLTVILGGQECLCWSLSIGFTVHCNINLGWTWAPTISLMDRDLFMTHNWYLFSRIPRYLHRHWLTFMGVYENGGTPKSSNLIGISIINHPCWGTPIFGNTLMENMAILASSAKLLFKPLNKTKSRGVSLPFGPETGSSILFPSVCHLKVWMVSRNTISCTTAFICTYIYIYVVFLKMVVPNNYWFSY